MFLGRWLRRRRLERQARGLLDELFRDGELLRGTSLRRHHASRWILKDFECDGENVVNVWFGILRHPRPYSFSRQSHKVIEYYSYDVRSGRVCVLEGYNLTRDRGEDSGD